MEGQGENKKLLLQGQKLSSGEVVENVSHLIRGSYMCVTSHLPCPIGLERSLQGRLASISRSQLEDGQDIQNIAESAENIKQQQQTYKTKVEEVQTLIEEMKRKLDKARTDLGSAVRLDTHININKLTGV